MYIYLFYTHKFMIYHMCLLATCIILATSTANKHVDLSDLEVGIPRPLERFEHFDYQLRFRHSVNFLPEENCGKGLETSFHAFHAFHASFLVQVAQPAEDQDKDGDQQRCQDGLQRRHRDLSHVSSQAIGEQTEKTTMANYGKSKQTNLVIDRHDTAMPDKS